MKKLGRRRGDCLSRIIGKDKLLIVTGKNGEYEIGDMVARNPRYRLYNCIDGDGRELLFQVAADTSYNGELSKNAWVLSRLAQRSDEIEAEYAALQAGKEWVVPLNYNLAFPQVHDSFIAQAKQVNILGFRNVASVKSIIPLVKIWKDSLRVDLRTSAWMAGKLLKLLVFTHDHRFQVGDGKISGNNVLIEPDEHYILIFDWSGAIIHDEQVPAKIRRGEIKAAAQVIIKALGDDLECARENDADVPYTNYLRSLAVSGESDASKAHETFYRIVDELCENPDSVWEKGFYKFTTYDCERR